MPRLNGTGPAGAGPMTGRGQGPCGSGQRQGQPSSWFGRAFGGRGFGRRWFANDRRTALDEKEKQENEKN